MAWLMVKIIWFSAVSILTFIETMICVSADDYSKATLFYLIHLGNCLCLAYNIAKLKYLKSK